MLPSYYIVIRQKYVAVLSTLDVQLTSFWLRENKVLLMYVTCCDGFSATNLIDRVSCWQPRQFFSLTNATFQVLTPTPSSGLWYVSTPSVTGIYIYIYIHTHIYNNTRQWIETCHESRPGSYASTILLGWTSRLITILIWRQSRSGNVPSFDNLDIAVRPRSFVIEAHIMPKAGKITRVRVWGNIH
jgi:hypothetical protein